MKKLTSEERKKIAREWIKIIKESNLSSKEKSNKAIATALGASRTKVDGIVYENNKNQSNVYDKDLVALAISFPSLLTNAAAEIGIEIPSEDNMKELENEKNLALKREINELRALLDSYKDSNQSMQEQLSTKEEIILNKDETIKKLAETISKLSSKIS